MDAVAVHGNRDLANRSAGVCQALRRGPDGVVDVRFGEVRPAEALRYDAHAEPACTRSPESLDVAIPAHSSLPGIEAVLACDSVEEEGHVLRAGCDGTGVVQRQLDGKDPRVGDQSIGRLQAVGPAPGAGDPDRA